MANGASRTASLLTLLRIVHLSIFWSSIIFLWTALLVVLVPLHLESIAPSSKGTALATVVPFGTVLQVILIPLFGKLSDLTRRKWGRSFRFSRRSFVLGGALIASAAVGAMPFSPDIYVFALCYTIMSVGASILLAPYAALLPDVVPFHLRGLAGGLSGFFATLGSLAGGFVGVMVSHVPIAYGFLVVALLLIVGAVITLGVQEPCYPPQTPPDPTHSSQSSIQSYEEAFSHHEDAIIIPQKQHSIQGEHVVYDGVDHTQRYHVHSVPAVEDPLEHHQSATRPTMLSIIHIALRYSWNAVCFIADPLQSLKSSDFRWTCATVLLSQLGIYTVQEYAEFLYSDFPGHGYGLPVIGVVTSSSSGAVGIWSTLALSFALVSSLGAGALSDGPMGKKIFVCSGLILVAIGCLLMPLVRIYWVTLVAGMFYGMGYGMFFIITGVAAQVLPGASKGDSRPAHQHHHSVGEGWETHGMDENGRDMGVLNAMNSLPNIITTSVVALLYQGTLDVAGARGAYAAVFGLACVCASLGSVAVWNIRQIR